MYIIEQVTTVVILCLCKICSSQSVAHEEGSLHSLGHDIGLGPRRPLAVVPNLPTQHNASGNQPSSKAHSGTVAGLGTDVSAPPVSDGKLIHSRPDAVIVLPPESRVDSVAAARPASPANPVQSPLPKRPSVGTANSRSAHPVAAMMASNLQSSTGVPVTSERNNTEEQDRVAVDFVQVQHDPALPIDKPQQHNPVPNTQPGHNTAAHPVHRTTQGHHNHNQPPVQAQSPVASSQHQNPHDTLLPTLAESRIKLAPPPALIGSLSSGAGEITPLIDIEHHPIIPPPPETILAPPEDDQEEPLKPLLSNASVPIIVPVHEPEAHDGTTVKLMRNGVVSGPMAIQLHYLRRWPSLWSIRYGKPLDIVEELLPGEIPNQVDVLSSEFETPEFACDVNDSRSAAVYCQGELLHAVMMLHLFRDSKTFVDKPLKMDPDQIMARFKERFPNTITIGDREALREFVNEHFDVEGKELEKCDLMDWEEEPPRLLSIEDDSLREFALKVNAIWKNLCRTVKKKVSEQPERFSLLYVPNEFIIPGGRFREFYYWDTYWVVKGLLASGMHETTRKMIGNFQHLIERNGFVPNGGRIYYMRRSQPPMFIPMIYEYHTATKDDQFLRNAIAAMEKELEFWKTKRTVNIVKNDRNYTVFRYRADSNVPRPESYREDYETAQQVLPDKKRQLWRDIASAAESGWDFSSRWMADKRTMRSIETSDIAPVDLNAFMCWNMAILAHLHGRLGNHTRRAELFRERADFVDTFTDVFFDYHEGVWFDIRVHNGEWEHDAYPSVAAPLFTECYHRLDATMMIDVLDTLERYGYLGFPGGIPASLVKGTEQQWDYPNGWAPIQHMVIEGLRKSSHYSMQQKAYEIASKWINRNYQAFMQDHKMWEKYDVTQEQVQRASGGEYEVQAGFGWTNGVALDLMVTYGKVLRVRQPATTTPSPLFKPYWYSSSANTLNTASFTSNLFVVLVMLVISRVLY